MLTNTEAQDTLLERFYEYFAKRGVVPEQIASYFIPMYESDKRALTVVGRYAKERQLQGLPLRPGFLIKYSETYATFRYTCDEDDYPVDVSTHKSSKLLCPPGLAVPVFLTWSGPVVGPIVVCESVVKASSPKLKSVRKCTVGSNGVRGCVKNKRLDPELQRLAPGNEFEICFDASAHKGHFCFNDDIAKSTRELTRLLYAHGATKVTVVVVPPNGRYDQGLDDYLAAPEAAYLDLETYEVDEDGSTKISLTNSIELTKEDLVPAIPLIENLINFGECNMLVGPPKCGKTRIAIEIAIAVASGGVNLFEHEDFRCAKTEVLLMLLEDQRIEVRKNLQNFAQSMKVPYPIPGLHLVTEMPEGAFIETKVAAVLKANPNIKLIILDNHTTLERIAGRVTPEGGLTQREYTKMEKYTKIARAHNVAVLILVHAKKNSTKSTVISDKTNSTGTASGAVDNLNAVDFVQMNDESDRYRRVFSTQARSHPGYSFILDIPGEAAPRFVGDTWEFALAPKQQEYVAALYMLAMKAGGVDKQITSKQLAEATGRAQSTVLNTMQVLINKGWVNSSGGVDGGYTLTERAQQLSRTNV